jgi:hypothetical protein
VTTKVSKHSILGVVILLLFTTSARADCGLVKVADYTVEWVGTGWGTRTLEYVWVCNEGSSTTSGGSGSGGTTATSPSPTSPTTPPYVDLVYAETSTPNRITLIAEGNSVITAMEVIVDGTVTQRISGISGYFVDGVTLAGPSIGGLPVGRHAVAIRGCTAKAVCAMEGFELTRSFSPSGTTGSVTAAWVESEGPVVYPRLAAYNMRHGEDATYTAYSGVYTMYDSTRVMLSASRMSVSYSTASGNPEPQYSSRHFVTRTGPAEYASTSKLTKAMAACPSGTVIGPDDVNISACCTHIAWGAKPTAGIELTSLYLLGNDGMYSAGIVNGTLSYSLP